MICVIGENMSDAGTLKCLIKRLLKNDRVSVQPKGCDSKGELLRKGARIISARQRLGDVYFVICADADSEDPTPTMQRLRDDVVRPTGLTDKACCVVPVQEIEAWILADICAVTNVIKSWVPKPVSQPESISSPKEHLLRLSRASNYKPRYNYVTHNEQVAKYLNMETVYKLCPSFRTLADFISPLIGKV